MGDKFLERIEELIAKAKKVGKTNVKPSGARKRDSLDMIIRTKEQAARFMRDLEAASKE